MSTKSLLLEIGTEEIPARFIPRELEEIKTLAAKILDEAAVGHGELASYATPRRLAVIVNNVPLKQEDRVREAFGPPKQAAFDKDGNPTKAAIGFAKSQGIDPAALTIKPREGKGEYVCAVVEEKGREVIEILPELLQKVVLSMSFPKAMRWGDGTVRYARPIHWIVALFGSDPVRFDVEGIRSSNVSCGHRFLDPEKFTVRSPEDYLEALRDHEVEVDVKSRMQTIKAQANELAGKAGGTAEAGDELKSILACIVEKPQCVLGDFEADYLELPDELLTSVMIGHQKYIPIQGPDGRLRNAFVVVSNTTADNAYMVKAGAERVIRARFDDARFYYTEDRKAALASRVEALGNVTFQEKLGSLLDKTGRLKALAGALAETLCPDKKDLAVRAAELAKADLITGVVFEFPELQGIMGMYYAQADGEPAEVAQAIREQYLPAFSGDRVPESDVGTVLALADRLDNLASFFSIGLKPTGSEDPFALRRQTLGIISIMEGRGIQVSIRDLLKPALSGLDNGSEVEADLMAFIGQRMEPLLLARDYAFDIVQSVIERAAALPMSDLLARLDALKAFKTHAKYTGFLVGIKRVRNITPDGDLPAVKPKLFNTDEEKALYAAYEKVGEAVVEHAGNYGAAIEELTALTESINTFFDKVLVMDKDNKVKQNRLSLLKGIWELAHGVADLSKLQETA